MIGRVQADKNVVEENCREKGKRRTGEIVDQCIGLEIDELEVRRGEWKNVEMAVLRSEAGESGTIKRGFTRCVCHKEAGKLERQIGG